MDENDVGRLVRWGGESRGQGGKGARGQGRSENRESPE